MIVLSDEHIESFKDFSRAVLNERYLPTGGSTEEGFGEHPRYRGNTVPYEADYRNLQSDFAKRVAEAVEVAKLFVVWLAKRRLTQ